MPHLRNINCPRAFVFVSCWNQSRLPEMLGCPDVSPVILSGVAASRSEAATQSKDPYPLHGSRRSPQNPWEQFCRT